MSGSLAGDGIFGGGKCVGAPCSSCKKLRNWFAGPVTGCDCLSSSSGHCNHSTGGGGWGALVIAVAGIIIGIIFWCYNLDVIPKNIFGKYITQLSKTKVHENNVPLFYVILDVV